MVTFTRICTNTTTIEQYVYSDKWVTIDNTVPTSYTYSAWVYSDNPQAELFLQMKDASNTNTYDSVVTNIKGVWTLVTKTFIVPAAVKKIRLRLDNNAQGNVWFDDVEIRKTNDPSSSDRNLNISYNAFKAPLQIEETNVDKISFIYNDTNNRSVMFYGSFDTDKSLRPFRKHYSADGTMEVKQNTKTGVFEFITYVGGDGYTAPIAVKSDGNGTLQNYLYLHRDYQGSILAITNDSGIVIEKRLYDAWGSIIKTQDGAGNTLNGLTVLDRGYTGHEHLQSVGLIHMNARIYDPMLHRFLQSDNFIQDPTNTQNYNQYGYGLNNPLLYTDPSGNIVITKENNGGYCGCGTENGELSNGQQTFIGNTIKTIADNWDRWGMKDWSKRNLNFRNWGDGINSAKDFIGRNVQSGLDDIGDFFGIGGKKSEGPPPNMSNYINSNYGNFNGNNLSGISFVSHTRSYVVQRSLVPSSNPVVKFDVSNTRTYGNASFYNIDSKFTATPFAGGIGEASVDHQLNLGFTSFNVETSATAITFGTNSSIYGRIGGGVSLTLAYDIINSNIAINGMGNWNGDRDSGGSSLGIKARALLDAVLSRLSPYRPIPIYHALFTKASSH